MTHALPEVLLPCPLCRGAARMDWTCAFETHRHAWRACEVHCCQDGEDKHCDQHILIHTDARTLNPATTAQVEAYAARVWNRVSLMLAPTPGTKAS